MRVLYILNDTFRKGGTESVVFNYYNHINSDDIQIDFMIHTTQEEAVNNPVYQELKRNGVVIHVVTPRRISVKQNIADMEAVYQQIRYDIVHAHADCANAFILSVARKNGVKIRIAHSHSTEIPIKIDGVKSLVHRGYLELCRKRILYEATHYMACSDKAASWLFGKRNYSAGKVYILNNAVDLEKFSFNEEIRNEVRNKLGISQEFVVGHIGRFSPPKNHPFILQLAKMFQENKDDVKFLLVGDGPDYQDVKDAASELGLDNIIFYGGTDKVEEIIQAFDTFILPSLWEGLGVAIIEAQANGLRCFVSDSKKVTKASGITPLVKFIPIDNPYEWWNAIVAINKSGSRTDYSQMIRKKGYDILEESSKLEKYYKSIIKEQQ